MSKTINRIITLVKSLNLSARQFDISIGAANGYTLRMEKNNASVGSDVIERIVKTYPQVNLVWLITGKGEMFIKDEQTKAKLSDEAIEAYIDKRLEEKLAEEKKALMNEILKEIEDAKK